LASVRKKIVVAGFWVILIFGLSQLVRLGSNLIATRLLVPEMFGVMALVNVVIVGIEMFSDLGLWAYVVRQKNPEDPHMLNVVWTMQVVRGWIMFSCITILAASLMVIDKYYPSILHGIYTDTRLPLMIFLAGISSAVSGYKSMASPILSRKLNLGKLELAELAAQTTGASVMLAWIWFYPSIWALVSAGIITTVTITTLSYALFPYRHRFAWDKIIVNEVFNFGKWIVIASILTYLSMQGDRLFLASAITARELGIYSIAFMLAGAIATVTHTLVVKIFFPVLTTVVNENRHMLKQRYYQIRAYLDFSVFFAVGLLVSLAPLIIDILYDDRYKEAGWMLQILSFSVIGSTLSILSLECLSALAITKVNMWVMAARSIGIFVGLPVAYHLFGLHGAIWAISLNIWLSLPIVYWSLAKNDIFSWFNEIKLLPMIAVGYTLGRGLLLVINKFIL
jgi:O-antigen/teichoic acid export membrane protein